jgi:hypothetical protein
MKDEQVIRNFVKATMNEYNTSVFLRLMNLSPEVYRRCLDALADGIVSIDYILTLPYQNDLTVTEMLDARDAEMSFVYNQYPDPAIPLIDISAYCTDTLKLDELIAQSCISGNSFVPSIWSKFLLNARTKPTRDGSFYDNAGDLAADFAVSVLPLYIGSNLPPEQVVHPENIFPIDRTLVFIEEDTDIRDFAQRLYAEIFIGRGIVECFHSNENYRTIMRIDDTPALLSTNYSFAEELFNGYYPYNNTVKVVKDIRSIVVGKGNSLTKDDIDYAFNNITKSSFRYDTLVRTKLTYLISLYWIAVNSGLYQSTDTLIKVGPIINDIISLMDFMKNYITSLSTACRRYMRVS